MELTVDGGDAPALGEGEWWAHELEGCEVIDGEQLLGTVSRLIELPSCEALEVRPADGGEVMLVPMVKDAVRRVAPARRAHRGRPRLPRPRRPRARAGATEPPTSRRTRAAAETRSRAREHRRLHAVPEWFEWFASQRHVANVLAAGSRLECVNPREHTPLSGGQVDDTPFGGGAGMVLRVDVLDSALRAHYGVDPVQLRTRRRVIALAPGGRLLDEQLVDELAGEPALTLLCGRYEGFDERILEHFASDVVSIGRYVLSGGELAAMVLCDAVLRKLPGALGHERSAAEESFSAALEGNPGVSALHPPRRVPRLARARGAAVRSPRADRELAARAQPRAGRAVLPEGARSG